MGAGRRGLVILAVLGLHVLAVMLFRLQRPRVEAASPVIEILVLIGADSVSASPAPQVQAELVPPPVPMLVMPNVEVLPEPAADQEVPVAQSAEAPASRDSAGNLPPQVQRIDYILPPYVAYPPKAKRRRETGMVQLVVLVGADGLAKEAKVYRSSGHVELDEAAIEAVFNAVFRPETENGVARAIRVIVPINFYLTVQPDG